MIDLHCHSKYSDGDDKIEEILEQAKKLRLKQVAITDHNILAGSILAHQLSPENTIVGIEFTVCFKENSNELHLLGYFPNESEYKRVNSMIKIIEGNKSISTMAMLENLQEQGYDISIKDLKEFATGTINRKHICLALVKRGYIKTEKEGWDNLVGDNSSAYVESERLQIDEVCDAIHEDGGIAVLAHPYNYKMQEENVFKMLDGVVNLVDGIECFHPSATEENSEKLVEYAKKHNKKITGGSDYHGMANKHGSMLNAMQIDDSYAIK